MNFADFEDFAEREGRGGPFRHMAVKTIPYPLQMFGRGVIRPSIARIYTLDHTGGVANVVIAIRHSASKRAKEVEIWCGDQFLEAGPRVGRLAATARCTKASEGLRNGELLEKQMVKHYGSLTRGTPCDFWSRRKLKPPQLCDHAAHVLSELFPIEDLEAMAQQLDRWLAGVIDDITVSSPEICLARFLFQVPTLLEGERGSGKTFLGRSFARDEGIPLIELGGHEGIDAVDLLGTYVPMSDRSLIWKDGALSEAFRLASKGQRAVLLIDELLRIPQRQLSVTLTALSPDEGHYQLRTGRILRVEDNVACEEVLRCKVEHLAIVATTNVGAGYAVESLDPAIAERWLILRWDTTPERLRDILIKLATNRGFSLNIAEKLVRFFVVAKELRNTGQIAQIPTARTCSRAIELAASEAEVGTMILNQALLWVARDLDGYPVTEQLDSVRGLVEKIFSTCTGPVFV